MSDYKSDASDLREIGGAGGPQIKVVPSGSENFGFFSNQVIDNLMHVVIELGAEHWALRRRMFILETILENSGAMASKALECFHPSKDDLAAWEEERDVYIKRAFGALSRTGSAPTDR